MEILINEAMRIFPPGQALVLVMLYFIIRMLREVHQDFRSVKEGLNALDVWAKEHEKRDDERFQELRRMEHVRMRP